MNNKNLLFIGNLATINLYFQLRKINPENFNSAKITSIFAKEIVIKIEVGGSETPYSSHLQSN